MGFKTEKIAFLVAGASSQRWMQNKQEKGKVSKQTKLKCAFDPGLFLIRAVPMVPMYVC